jgi:hypothetical protein
MCVDRGFAAWSRVPFLRRSMMSETTTAAEGLAAGKFVVQVKVSVPKRLDGELDDAPDRRTIRDALKEFLDDLEPALGATADVPRDDEDQPIYAIERHGQELTAVLTMTPEEDGRERVGVEICILAPDGAEMMLADSATASSAQDKISEFIDSLDSLLNPVDVREISRKNGEGGALRVSTIMALKPVAEAPSGRSEVETRHIDE